MSTTLLRFHFLLFLTNTCHLFGVFITAILVGVKCYLFVILICIFLITSKIEHFSCVCFSTISIYLLSRNVQSVFFCFCFFFSFSGPHLQHMEVPRPGVKSELQLQTCTTATAMQDLSRICDLCCSLLSGIFNLLREAKD